MLQPVIAQQINRLRSFCSEQHITDCVIFGSATRDDFSAASDVDVVVAFDKDQQVTFFRLNRLAEQMAQILGRPVDLHTWAEIHPKLQPKIQREGVSVFERPAG